MRHPSRGAPSILRGRWSSPAPKLRSPQLWHAHEMVFGFVAAIAGFLLAAVPDWTGRQGYSGRPLALLLALWLAGRTLM